MAVPERDDSDALDDRCPVVDPLAAGNGQFLHVGWFYSHIAGGRGDCDAGAHHSGPKPCCVTKNLLGRTKERANSRGEHRHLIERHKEEQAV